MAKADAPTKEKKEKKEKAPRAPSPYNEFMKTEIAKVKAGNPGLDHKEAFKVAASHVSHFCPRLRHPGCATPVAPLLFLLCFFFFLFLRGLSRYVFSLLSFCCLSQGMVFCPFLGFLPTHTFL